MAAAFYIPVKEYIEDLWPKNLLDPPSLDFLDGVWMEPLNIQQDPNIRVRCALLFETELALNVPGLDSVSIVLAGTPDSRDSAFMFEFDVTPKPTLKIVDVPVALRFSSDLLKPARRVADPSGGADTIEVNPDVDHVDITLATMTLAVDFDGNITLDTQLGFNLPLCLIGDTGVAVEAEGIQFFLGHDTPPPGKPSGWRGVHIPDAKLYLPGELAGIVGNLDLKDGYIGNGGFSGTVSDTWSPALSATLFGMDFTLQSAALGFVQNTPTQCEIKGTVNVPFFDGPVGVDIGINHDGSFGVTLASSTGLVTLSKPGIMDLELDSLGFAVEKGTFVAKLSGEITPDVGGLDWPTFKVKELSIDSHGNVRLDGGWLDLPDQYVLDFHGFQIEVTKLGFGKTEDGGKWIGFSGGLKLVDGLQAGASVEGLRVTWFDDGRPVRVTLNGVGVEFEVPDVLRFKGGVSYRELPGDVHRFDGAITLELIALDLEIDGVLVVGSAPGYTFFAIYLDAELPAGIPLWATGVSLFGMAGLFALQMEPDKHPDEKWYGVGTTDGWYHRGTVGVTDLNKKWVNKQGSLALGAGVTLGTAYDDGYTFNGKVLFVIVFPGPILLLEGKANLLKERADLSDEAIFRAIAVLDGRAGTFTFGLDAMYKYDDNGKLLDIRGGVEAFFSFTDASLWHVWVGQKDPKEKRIRAEIFSLFEANAYLMIDPRQLATGAWVGYSNKWSFGPLSVTVEAWIEGDAIVSFKPVHFHGELWLHGKAALAVFGFGLTLTVDAKVSADVFDPFHVLADLSVGISLPWPLPSFSADITLEWGPEPTLPPLPVPLKEIAVEHFKVTTKWPLPRGTFLLPDYDRGDGFLKDPAPTANETAAPPSGVPVVPIDCRPHVTFSRSVNDDAQVGVNGQPVTPEWERIGDPAKNEGPVKVRYAVKAVTLHRWNSQSSSWELSAAAPKETGADELYGSWAPLPAAGGAAAQVKLWLWSKTAFDYTRHTGGAWDEWFTEADPGYPCVPLAPGTSVCCDFSDLPLDKTVEAWSCREHPELSLQWVTGPIMPMALSVADFKVALCFPGPAGQTSPVVSHASTFGTTTSPVAPFYVILKKPASSVKLTIVGPKGVEAAGQDSSGKWHGPVMGGTYASPVVRIDAPDLVRVLVIPLGGACLLQICAEIGPPDPGEVQRRSEMEQHLIDELALWSQTGQVLRADTTYRLTVRTTLETAESSVASFNGVRTQTALAYFRTEQGPGLANLDIPQGTPASNLDDMTLMDAKGAWIGVDGTASTQRVLKSDLNSLGPYVAQTVPPTVPALGQKPPLPRPVYRAYDVGVQFNEDYVDLMYRLERRDLGLYLYDNNNRPVRDAQGRLIILGNPWGASDNLTLDESDTRWITTINENGCGSIDTTTIPRDNSLGVGNPEQVLIADTLYEGRLVPLLLHDDFGAYAKGTTATGPAGTLDAWTVVDQGSGGPSNWTIAQRGTPPSNILTQAVPIWGGSLDNRDPVKPGTMLVRGDPAWTDYRFSVFLRSTDDHAIGVVVRYVDSANYYRYSMDRSARTRRLVRVVNGTHTILAEDEFAYRQAFDYLISVEAIGPSIRIYHDGAIVFQVKDPSFDHGRVGLYCWHNSGSEFADVRLDDFRSTAPVVYRFKFTTSQYANFFHQMHSYQDETWLNTALTNALAAELAGAVDLAQPITDAEGRAYDDLASGLLGQAAGKDTPEVQVTRLEQAGETMALLLRGPEPIDWMRARLLVARTGAPVVQPDPPGVLKVTGGSIGVTRSIQESVGLVLREAMDLTGTRIEYVAIPGPIAESSGDPVLFKDDFGDPPGGRLFTEDFGPNALDKYTIVDQGTNLTPSSWKIAANEIVQTSSIYGGTTSGTAPDKPGTNALVGSPDWTNVQITTTIRSTTGGTIGVLFRYRDETAYYRFSMDANLGYRRLVKQVPGQTAPTVLWQDAVAYTKGQAYEVVIYAYADWLVGYLDRQLLFVVRDGDVTAGRVGWYCWQEPGAHFSALTVDALAAAPVLWSPTFADLSEVQIVDEAAVTDGPSNWAVSSGALTQSANIHGTAAGALPSGTYAIAATPPVSDIRISVALRSDAAGDIGVMFRYRDPANYYRFSMDQAGGARRLIKKVAGAVTVLWHDAVAYVTGTTYEVKIDALGSGIAGWIDGAPVFSVTDSDLRVGQVALYCASNPGARFERILFVDGVRRVRGWTIEDQGPFGGPSIWSSGAGRLSQRSSIGGGAVPAAPGTQVLAGDPTWTDYRTTVRILSDDDGAIGLVFRYADDDNYYRLSLDQQGNSHRLIKKTAGVVTTVWQQSSGYVVGVPTTLTVDAVGERLRGYLDQAALFDVTDADHPAGMIGLYSASNDGANFESAVVARAGLEEYALFQDRFAAADLSAWTPLDEGTGGPSVWKSGPGVVEQTSSIGSPPIDRNTLDKPGTMLLAGDVAWTDVIVQSRLLSIDGSTIGVLFRHLDQTHYYRFSMDRVRGYRRLVKNVGGTFTSLWEDDVAYDLDRPYQLTIVATGSRLSGFLDGVPLFVVTDPDIAAGRFGLYCWNEPKAFFWDVSVYPASQAYTSWLLADRFTVLVQGRWKFVDDGTLQGPSVWQVSGGQLNQTSSIASADAAGAVPDKPGTYAQTGDPTWSDYRTSVRLVSDTDGGIGLMFRYRDNGNYYRFSIDRGRGFRRLTKKVAGTVTTLWQDAVQYTTGQPYVLTVDCIGRRVRCYLNGELLAAVEDGDLLAGSVALYCWGNSGAHFSEFRVGQIGWAPYYAFADEASLPSGTQVRVYAGNQTDAPPGAPWLAQRFIATAGERGHLRIPRLGTDVRILDAAGHPGHRRTIVPPLTYAQVAVKGTRKADGTALIITPATAAGTQPFQAGQYRLGFTYARDNRAADPNSLILREDGLSVAEQVAIEVPWETRS